MTYSTVTVEFEIINSHGRHGLLQVRREWVIVVHLIQNN